MSCGAGVEEGRLQAVEGVALATVVTVTAAEDTTEGAGGLFQTGAAVEGAGVAVQFVPGTGGLRQPPVQPQAFTVLLDPGPVTRPGENQRLVGQVDGVAVRRQEAG